MKPSEEEQALDALLRGGRVDPSPADLGRLERGLASHLREPRLGGRGAAWKVVVFVAAIGLVATPFVLRRGGKGEGTSMPTPISTNMVAEAATSINAPAPPSEATVNVLDLPNAKAPAHASAPTVATSVAPTESEASYLRRAQGTLAGSPNDALTMLDAYPMLYPHGSLAQERDVMEIDALARLGRTGEARTKAEAFEARYPHSAHESRLSTILGKDAP